MLSATTTTTKSAQNCQNLPKFAKDETLRSHQKSRFQCFLKIKIYKCRRSTNACFHHLDFQSKNFSHALFIVKKRPLYVNFNIPLCAKWRFFKDPQVSWIWDFLDMYLTHLETRIWSPSIHTYFIKWFFWPPKLCCIPWA